MASIRRDPPTPRPSPESPESPESPGSPESGSPLVIVGAGGHGRETLDIVEAINALTQTFDVVGFVGSSGDTELLSRRRLRLLGDIDQLSRIEADYALGIGMPGPRRRVHDQLRALGRQAVRLVHPLASVGADNRLGDGVILAAGARVTTNVTLGCHTHLNLNAVVSHDCEIGDFVTLSPGAIVNGDVQIEDDVFLGTGAIVTPQLRIGRGAVVGAGAVVLSDVPPGATAKGVPARW